MADIKVTAETRLDTRKAERDLDRFARKAEKTSIKLGSLDSRKFTQPLGKITGSVTEFQKSLEASNARVIAFTASAGVLYTVVGAFKEMAKAAIEVERSMADINVILNTTSSGLKKFSGDLFNVAKNTGQSFYEVADAAKEFARQGLSMEKTVTRTRDALILMRLSGMDATTAVNSLTAAINSFNQTAITSTQIINKMANVDAAFAVSTNDLAAAISRVGSSAEGVKVGFDELMAVVTSAQQTTARGGKVIGNSLKTIFTRIQRTEVVAQLESLGVQVKKTNGELRPAMAVLSDFAKAFDKLGPTMKAQTAELVGGVYQMNILKAILGDLKKEYSVYNQALRISIDSTDEAIKRNEELNKTMAALLNESIQNLTAFGAKIGQLTFEPVFRKLLEGFNSLTEQTSIFGDIGKFLGFNEKDANDFGGKVAGGIMKSIGNFLSGPGMIAIVAVAGKLFIDFSKFLTKSVGDMMGMNRAAQEQAAIQTQILSTLRNNPDVIKSIENGEISRLKVERQIVSALRDQIMAEEQLVNLSRQMAGTASRSGIGTTGKGGTSKFTAKSAGYVPNFKNDWMELAGARMEGYQPGDIRRMNIPGEGRLTYNNNERVSYRSGKAEIIPPGEAGKRHDERMSNLFARLGGGQGYEGKVGSSGFVPNLLNIITSLRLGAHKQGRQGSSGKLRIRGDVLAKEVGPELGKVISYAIPGSEYVTINTMGQQAPISKSEAAGFTKGTGRKASAKGAQQEAVIAARKGGVSLEKFRGKHSMAQAMDGKKLKLPYDAGEKAGGRVFPVESKPSFRARYIAQIFKKTLYETNSSSLRHLKRRLTAKMEGGDEMAAAHLRTLQKRIGIETSNRENELALFTKGVDGQPAISSLSDMNREMGFDTKNALYGRKQNLFGATGFIPNLAKVPRLISGRGGPKTPTVWDATSSAAMLLPESGIAAEAGKSVTASLPGSDGKTQFKFNVYDPDITKGRKKRLHDQVTNAVTAVAVRYAKQIGFPDNPLTAEPDPKKYFNSGAMKAATGTAFEAAMDAAFQRSKDIETATWDVRSGAGKAQNIRKLFRVPESMAPHADFKVSDSAKNQKSMAKKIQATYGGQMKAQLEKIKDSRRKQQSKGGKRGFSGFIPNFLDAEAVEKSMKTESMMGAKDPTLDYDSRVGWLVRDNATQPTAKKALADHSDEGLNQAIKNSKSLQDAYAAKGFVPNLAEGGTTGFDMGIMMAGMGMLAMGMKDASDRFKDVTSSADQLKAKFEEFEAEVQKDIQTQTEQEAKLSEANDAIKEHISALREDKEAIEKKSKTSEKAEKQVQRVEGGKFTKKEQEKLDSRTKEIAGKDKKGTAKARAKAEKELIEAKKRVAKKHADELKDMERKQQAVRDELAISRKKRAKSRQAIREITENNAERNKLQQSLAAEANAHNRAAMSSNQLVGQGTKGVDKVGKGSMLAGRAQGMSMGVMMGLPMVGGLARGMGMQESTAAGVEKGLGFAAMGASTGNPYLMAAGAIAGVVTGTFDVFKGWRSELAEFNKEAEEGKEKLTKFGNSVQEYIKAHEAYAKAIVDPDIKVDQLKAREDATIDALAEIPAEFRNKIVTAATQGGDALQRTFDEINKTLQATSKELDTAANLQKQYEDSDTFMNWLTGAVGDNMFNAPAANMIESVTAKKNVNAVVAATIAAAKRRDPDMFKDPAKGRAWKGQWTYPHGIKAQNNQKTLGNFRRAGIDPMLIRVIEQGLKDDVTANTALVNAIRQRATEEMNAAQEAKKLAAIIKANKLASDTFFKNMQALGKQLENFHRNLKSLTDNMAERVKSRNKIKYEQDDTQREMAKMIIQSDQQLFKPFMFKRDQDSMSGGSAKMTLGLAKIIDKQMRAVRAAGDKSQNAALSVFQKEMRAASKLITDTQLKAAREGKALGAVERRKVKIAEQTQIKYSAIIASHLSDMAANPGKILDTSQINRVAKDLRVAGRTTQEIDMVINELKLIKTQATAAYAEAQNQRNMQTALLELQAENQEKLIRIQESLKFGGGVAGFMSKDRIWETRKGTEKRFAGELGPDAGLEIGRQNLNILSELVNDFGINISKSLDTYGPMVASAVSSLQSSLNRRLTEIGERNKSAALWSGWGVRPSDMQSLPQEGSDRAKEIVSAIDTQMEEAKKQSLDAAVNQVAAQLKLQNMPKDIEQIRINTSILQELYSSQWVQMKQTNFEAHKAALEAVGMTGQSLAGRITDVNNEGFKSLNENLRSLEKMMHRGLGISASIEDLREADKLRTEGRRQATMMTPEELQFEDKRLEYETTKQSLQDKKENLAHDLFKGIDADTLDSFHKELVAQGKHGEAAKMKKAMANLAGDVVGDLSPWWDLLGFVGIYRMWAKVLTTQDMESLDPDMKDLIAQGGMLGAAGKVADQSRLEADILGKTKQLAGVDLQIQSMLKTHPELIGKQRGGTTEETTMWRLLVEQENLKSEITIQTEELKLLKPKLQDLINKANEANENSRKLRKTLDEPILKELEKIEKDFDRLFPKKTSNRPDATEDREVASLLRGGLYGSPAVIPRYLPKIDKDLTQVQRAIEDQETQFVIDGDPTPKTRGHKDRLERHRQKRLDTEGRLRGGGPTGTRLGYNQFPLRSATTPKFQDVAGAGTPPIVPVAPAPVTPAPRAITPRPAAPVVGSSGVGSTGAPMFPGKFPEGAQDHGWKILQAYAAKARELYADQGEDKQNKAAEAAIKYARAQHKLNRPMVSLSVLKNTSGGVEVKPGHPRDPEALIPGLAIRQRPSFGDLQQQTNYNAIKQKAYSAALVHKEVFREGASPASTAQNWRGYQSRDSEGGAAGGGFTGYSLDVDRREIATRNERVAKLQEKLKAFREDPIKWEREHGILKEYHDAEMIEDYKKLEAALKKQWEITPDAVQGGLIPKMSDHDVLKNLLGEKNLGGLFPSLLTQEHSYRGAGIPHYIQGGPSAERDEVSGGSSGLPFSTRGKLKAQTHGLIERQIGHDLAASYETVLAIQGTKKKSKGVPALHGINIDDPDQKAKDTAALKYHALGMQGNYLYEGKKPTMEMRLGHETRVKALMERQKFLDEKYKVKGKGDKEYTLTNQIQAYQVAAEEALEKEKEINSKGGMINATADDKKILENHRKRRDDLKYEINSRIKFEEDRALKLNHSFQGQLAAIRKLKKLNAAETELIKERQRMMKLIKKTQGKPEIDMVGALRELRIFDLDRIDKQIKEKQGEFNRAEFSGLENDTELAKIKDAELNLRWKKAMARGGATMLGTTTDGRISTATSFPNDPNQRQFIPGAKALPENMRIDYSRPGYPGYHTGAVSTRRRGTLQQPLGGSAGVGPLGFMGGPKGSTLVRPPEAVAISQTGEVSLPHLQSLADKAKQEDRGYDEKVLRDMIDILKETHRNFYRSMQGELNDMRLELIKLSVAPKTQENLGKKARLAETEARKSMESLELGGYQDNLQMMFQRAGIQEQDYKDIMKLLPKWMQDRLGQAAGNKFKPGIGKIFERPEGEDGTFWTPDQIHGLGGMGPGMELGTGVSEGIAFRQIMAKFMNARLDAFDNEFTGLLYDNMWLQWDPTASMEQKLKTRGAINSARIRNYEIQFGEIFDETIDNEKAVAERKKIIEEYAQIQRENLSERIRKLDKEISLMSNDPTLFQQERVGKMRQRTKERLRALGDPNAAQEDKYTIGDTMDNIIESYKYGSKEMALQAEEGVWKLSQDFQSATSKAFTEAILGAKTLEEAFSDMFQNLAEHAVAQIVDIATKRFLFNTLAGIMGNKGGLATEGGFKRYARGGEVQGGSGTRDDVPALLQRGEYVIKQASAKKYGLSLLDLINSGAYGVPKRMAQGGYLQGESGRAYHGMGRVQGNPASNDPMYVVYPDGRRVAVDDMESIRRGRGLPTYTHTDPDPGLFEKRQYKVDYWRHLSEPTTHGGMGMDPTEVAKLKRQWEENAFADPVEGLRSKYTGDDFHADIALRNAFVYDSDKFPTTRGSYYSIDSRLSRRALTDQNNPRNAIRMKKVDSLFSYFKARQDELKQWREDVQEARDKRKKSMKNLLYFAAGASLLGYMMGEDMWGVGSKGGGKDDRNFFQRIMSGDFGAGGRKQGGGGRRGRWGRLPGGMRGGRRQRPIRGGWPSNSHPVFGGGGTQVAATGGFILGNMVKRMAGGGTIGEDNIPALLTGGEYVISKDAVNKYGVDFFHNLNRGQQEVHRFAKGGPVLGEGFQRNASATPVSGGDIKNDIIINVNVDQTGGVTSDVTSSGSEPMSDKKAKGLAIMIKQQVVKTLVEQKRQGGMFDLSAMRRNL